MKERSKVYGIPYTAARRAHKNGRLTAPFFVCPQHPSVPHFTALLYMIL